MIPRTVLIAAEPFGEGLSAERAGAAIGRAEAGYQSRDDPSLGVDLGPIEPGPCQSGLRRADARGASGGGGRGAP